MLNMNKENILFLIVGVLGGLIIGFAFANSVNQRSSTLPPGSADMRLNSNMPPGHPDVGDQGATGNPGGMQPEVQAAIEKAEKSPEDADAQMAAASMYIQISRFKEAITYLERANKIKPADIDIMVELGNSNFDSDNYPEAEKWYMAALAKKPNDPNVRTDLGLTFVFREPPNYDRAIQEFKKSLEYDPNHIKTLQNLTVAYSKKGQMDNAKSTLAALKALDPKNPALKKLGADIGVEVNQ